MAENVIAPSGNFASLSYLKEDSKLCLLIDVCTILNLEKKKIKSLSYRKKANYLNYSYGLHIDYFSYILILLEQNYSFLWCYVRYFN